MTDTGNELQLLYLWKEIQAPPTFKLVELTFADHLAKKDVTYTVILPVLVRNGKRILIPELSSTEKTCW